MKGRVKGLLVGPGPVREHPDQADQPPAEIFSEPPNAPPNAQRQALQVLTLAQRTAEDHVANAHRQADKICADARATAERIVRDAEAHANELKREADKTLAEARATAAQIAREAQGHADTAHRSADTILAEARTAAEEIAKEAQANADDLKHQAQQRYQDVVGSLATKREALQHQIEALEQFDHEYRARLTSFMQAQLRALWVDEPKMSADLEDSDALPAALPAIPAQTSR